MFPALTVLSILGGYLYYAGMAGRLDHSPPQGRESTSFGLPMPLTRSSEVVCWAVHMITRLRAQKRSLEWIDPVWHLCPDLNAWMWRAAVLSVCAGVDAFQKGWKRTCTEIPRALRGALKHCLESSAGLLPGLREVVPACVWFSLLFGGLVVRIAQQHLHPARRCLLQQHVS